ncbi:MAG: peptidoglycan-binding protein [Minisyncoccia bacterium]
MTSLFRLKSPTVWIAIFTVLILLSGFTTTILSAQEAPPPVDLCSEVSGEQTEEPCANTVCTTDGGVWNGQSCDLPESEVQNIATSTESILPTTQTDTGTTTIEIATSTDGTGGLFGGTINTGDAIATTSVENEINTNFTNLNGQGESNSSDMTSQNTNEAEVLSGAEANSKTGENEATGGVSPATVSTGDALSAANVINVVNTNIFNSEGLVLFMNKLFGGGLDLSGYDLSYFFDAPVDCDTNPMILSCRNSSDLNVINTNLATVTNSVIVRSSTGENLASSTEGGSAEIGTGDAYAAANVLNLVNTNLINSNYLLVSFNNFGDLIGNITLPDSNFFKKLLSSGGVLPEMNSSSATANNTNNANFYGTTTASGETGSNIASTTGQGVGEVDTGVAYTSADTYNQLNDTQIGGTSVFMLFRVWGDWTGSVKGLPPGMSWMETPTGIILTSDAPECSNNEDDDLDGFVDSSDSACHTNGNPNSEFTYDSYGTSESSPQCTNNTDDDGDGFTDVDDPSCFEESHGEMVYMPNKREQSPNGEYNSSNLVASSTNTANLENNVEVFALTGENEAVTENGTSTISTGNAYAVANVVNFVNTNIIGRNWIFALFNIFGDWSGDIEFGKPNLWIGAVAETTNPTLPGSDVIYRFTVSNRGDSDAENVVINAEFDKNMLSFNVDNNSATTSDGMLWRIGRIARGETKDFTYTAKVSNIPDGTSATVPLKATLNSNTEDSDSEDNSEAVTIVVTSPVVLPVNSSSSSGGSGGGGGGGGVPNVWTPDPKISMTKTANLSTSTVATTTKVNYEVVLYNDKTAGPVYKGVLTDTLYGPDGEVMSKRSWNLDTIAPGDLITLTYTMEFGSSTVAGLYKNVAKVTGKQNYSISSAWKDTPSVEVSSTVMFDEFALKGTVLETATTTLSNQIAASSSCLPLLNTNLRRGFKNDTSEVRRLQEFLNNEVQSNLPITGFFGSLTQRAVESFQNKYKEQVLIPLGLSKATGAVYTMTKLTINSLSCGETPVALQGAVETAQIANSERVSPSNVPKTEKPKVTEIVPKAKEINLANVLNATEPQPAIKTKGGLKSWLKGLFQR